MTQVYRVTQPMEQDGRQLGVVSVWTRDEARARALAAERDERGVEVYDATDEAVPLVLREVAQ